LAEDIFHRDLEELNSVREAYLTQLARTREMESRMEDMQQQLDRTKSVLLNPQSGDLLLLQYMACRLHLLRELTSGDYDDFFSARAQYSTWCTAQQQLYKETALKSLEGLQKEVELIRSSQEDALLQSKSFLKAITATIASDASPDRSRLSASMACASPHAIVFNVKHVDSFTSIEESGNRILDRMEMEEEKIGVGTGRGLAPQPFCTPAALSQIGERPTKPKDASNEVEKEAAESESEASEKGEYDGANNPPVDANDVAEILGVD
jgi:hypothetical protein